MNLLPSKNIKKNHNYQPLFLFLTISGNQDVIQRELKDFLDNNRFTERDIVRETGLTIVDASRFLVDGWHTKEGKRELFFKWYLQKKLRGKGLCICNKKSLIHRNVSEAIFLA